MNASKPLLVLMRSVAAGLCLFAMAQPALAQDAAKAPRKDLVLKGDEPPRERKGKPVLDRSCSERLSKDA